MDKIKNLIATLTEHLDAASIGELLFIHHVSLELISKFKDDEAGKHCQAMEQSIYNEIHRRVDAGELNLSDPQDFYGKLKEYYETVEDSPVGKSIKDSLLKMSNKKNKKGITEEFSVGLTKHGQDFFDRYRKELNIKPEPKSKIKIPSPAEIISGSSPKDIPNN